MDRRRPIFDTKRRNPFSSPCAGCGADTDWVYGIRGSRTEFSACDKYCAYQAYTVIQREYLSAGAKLAK